MITSTFVKSKKAYKVSFELAQERVGADRDVRVLGNFNDWSWDQGVKLSSGKNGYTGATELTPGTYQFRYLVDGHHWANDDTVDSYSDSGHGSTNCCFTLDEVKEDKSTDKKPAAKKSAAKKPAAKKATAKKDDAIEAATSAPASKPVVTPKATAKKKPAAKKPAAKKPATKKAAKAKTDDLKKIEGVGPKIAGLLNEAGINSFAELAKASEKQLADVLQKAGARFRLAQHDTWQEQATLAANGKMDELKKLQDTLKGGKK
ncbi:hypothetical protein LEM8419_00930 [Neolewinella maritima]|uniref:AMP-activated protein kinase glycogen-binding domain-containing protein n=1 Tax=Neolewinella maritima TaxID=1383882 RepID=A0ABM9AYT3_9BACT|nr:DUF4332 domain-containing protein [Neolewinella maritima]CAH0999630.1 hypothetical protein LEM8419_00930 [Neolewinella maritima]